MDEMPPLEIYPGGVAENEKMREERPKNHNVEMSTKPVSADEKNIFSGKDPIQSKNPKSIKKRRKWVLFSLEYMGLRRLCNGGRNKHHVENIYQVLNTEVYNDVESLANVKVNMEEKDDISINEAPLDGVRSTASNVNRIVQEDSSSDSLSSSIYFQSKSIVEMQFVPEKCTASPPWEIFGFGLIIVQILFGRCTLLPSSEKAEDAFLQRLHQFDTEKLEVRLREESCRIMLLVCKCSDFS